MPLGKSIALFCLAAGLLLALPAHAQVAGGGPDEQPAFNLLLTQWTQVINKVADEADRPNLPPAQVRELRDRLFAVKGEVEAARGEAEKPLQDLKVQLDALGAAPAEGEPPEAPDIAAKRQSLNEQAALFAGRIQEAELTIARIDDLDSELSTLAREEKIRKLLELFPFPLSPGTVGIAVPELFGHMTDWARAPADWWRNLTPEDQATLPFARFAAFVAVAIVVGWLVRRFLLRRFGRDPAIEDPSYARRLAGAVVEGVANGAIPALVFGAVLYRTLDNKSLVTGLFSDMVIGFSSAMIFFFVSRAFVRAALAPDLPAWSLEDIPPEKSRQIRRLVMTLAAVFAIDLFLIVSSRSLAVSLELESVMQLVFTILEAGIVILLMRPRFWAIDTKAEQSEDESARKVSAGVRRFWRGLRVVVVLVATASLVAALIGYADLAAYLINNLVASALIVAGLYLSRGLLREMIGGSLRSDFVQSRLGVRHRSRESIKFWSRGFLDLLILCAAVVLILPGWGIPFRDVLRAVREFLDGFTIGNVTLSPMDVVVAIIIFAVALIVTRMIQRLLSDQVLPQTNLDSGVRNSITSGIGYVGVVIAAALGISTLGLDLSNLALVAGALSVGIGFGLQTVVNNFVSGLILLVERPVKVGDWVIVGGHEGYIKRINVRATELETFQRASVIIPNSELVSTSVMNWTHKNKLGRVEIPVGVAYGSDIDLVMKILDDCLRADSRILKWPEPYVIFRGFGDSSLDFEARGYIGDVEYVIRISSDMRVAIYRAFKEHDIEIPFPQRDLHLKDIDRLATAIEGRNGAAPPEKAEPEPEAEEPAPIPAPRRRRAGQSALSEIGTEGTGSPDGES